MSDAGEMGYRIGYVVGVFLWPILFIWIGYLIAGRMNKGRDANEQVRWPIITGVVLAGLMVLGFLTSIARADPADLLDQEAVQ